MSIRLLCLVLLTAVSRLAGAQDKPIIHPADPIGLVQFTLPNGLTVYLTENHDTPQVFGAVVVKTGGKNDPSDATGMAHYLEHMLFKGTTTLGTTDYEKEKEWLDEINRLYDELGKTTDAAARKEIQKKINEASVKAAEYAIPNEMDRMISEIGGDNVNAFTSNDITCYYNSFPANQIEKWLDIYSHRFQNPVFRLFQSELETVYEEKNRSMDNPLSYLLERYMKHFYKVHPYGQQSILGETEHLKNPSLLKMYEYFNTHYVANNMALIISGDFDAYKVGEIIREKFSSWRSAPVPAFPEYKEAEFKGREIIKLRATPIKAGAIGFRIPAAGHPDIPALEVIAALLSNEEGSGLLDQLGTEGKLMTAGLVPHIENDYGAGIIYFVPKLLGQSLPKAERIVRRELEKIRSGNFEDKMLEAAKASLTKNFQRNWESNQDRVMAIGTCFSEGRSWSDFLRYEEQVKKITHDDIIRVATLYLGENSLVLYSRTGFPKKEKLEKPGFEPVLPKNETHSAYYESWKSIPSTAPKPHYVNFQKDITEISLATGVTLQRIENPFNQIFSVKIRYGTGKFYNPLLKILPAYVDISGSETLSATELKRSLYEVGCSISMYTSDHELVVALEGLDANLGEALRIVNEYFTHLRADDSKIKKIYQDKKGELKLSKSMPGFMAQVLLNYAIFGSNSPWLTDLSLKEIKKVKAVDLKAALENARNHETLIQYAGTLEEDALRKAFGNYTFSSAPLPKKERVLRKKEISSEPLVLLLDDKKAVQTQLYFVSEGGALKLEDIPVINAFNKYFGGDMSSLVFQEIREFRSLAYSTYANYSKAARPGERNVFLGYIGCQSDKTPEALEAMWTLIRQMPEKPERWTAVQSSLTENAQSERPGFRELAEIVENWKYIGYREDPNAELAAAYPQMSFQDIVRFYKSEVADNPFTLVVVGNTKSFGRQTLEKYGRIVEVKGKDLLKE